MIETRLIAADLRRHGFRVGTPSPAGVTVGLLHRRPGRAEVVGVLDRAGYDPAQYEMRESTIPMCWVVRAVIA